MKFKSRSEQIMKAPVLPLSVSSLSRVSPLGDEIFDTDRLPRPIQAINWKRETGVHGGVLVTDKLKNTNQFVSTQVMVVRDEVRKNTHLVTIEQEGLFHSIYSDDKISLRRLVRAGDVSRAHVALRKYDGRALIAYVVREEEKTKLFVDNTEIRVDTNFVDFPFLVIDQPTIGLPATQAPSYALLLYKDREKNIHYSRALNPVTMEVGSETKLPFTDSLGGADADLYGKKCLIRAQLQVDGKLVSHYVESEDFGRSFSEVKAVDLSAVPDCLELPANAPVMVDNTYNFHIPIAVFSDNSTILLDLLPHDDMVVAAIQTNDTGVAYSSARFPSMSQSGSVGTREGFGDGSLDGSGIIATLAASGRLLVSNSQSGGYSYPQEAQLNHEMQEVFSFRASECYTRGGAPNMVSMDYAFVESDSEGRPISSELWIDTWDMPLPEPLLSSKFENGKLTLKIEKSGWFFHGQTSFEIEPAKTFITKTTLNGFREVEIEFDDPSQVVGTVISFETKNVFYHYGAKILV